MGGLKPDLTASINSMEKVTTDTTEKESGEDKSETVETIACVPVIAENADVSITGFHFFSENPKNLYMFWCHSL